MADLTYLNEKQKEAVLHTEGPLLILAGAGSGKTGTVIARIAHLIDDCKVSPFNILAITFTNKAAGEMRDRVDEMIGTNAAGIWVSTFHSMCARILRQHAELLGYTKNFTIYDADDQRALMRQLIRRRNLDVKMFRERGVLAQISAAKNLRKNADEFYKESAGDYRNMQIAELFREYQEELLKNDAMDFDDLLTNAIALLAGFSEVLSYYQERFRYIMVDEYQDTNDAQFELVRLLAGKYKNLCVVGDDDQSIYAFRGANIENILGFEKEYPGAKVIRLEQNYRSTGQILDVANALIAHNKGRKSKSLWTKKKDGPKVVYNNYQSAKHEALKVVREIEQLRARGADPDEIAVLYRTNAQSRILEESFIKDNVPYRLIGGVNFYQRAEIKDMIAYLKTVENARDDIAVRRIINVPKRAIGRKTVDRIGAYALEREIGFYDACLEADKVPALGKAAEKVKAFCALIEKLREASAEGTDELIRHILDETGYLTALEAENTVDARSKIENLEELVSKAADFTERTADFYGPAANKNEKETEEATGNLTAFLEEISLIADIDQTDEGAGRVSLMTLHSSKGLEFDYVFLTGLEEGLFPSYRSVNDIEHNGVEEERRLCYVGITRAKKQLFLSGARERLVNGELIRSGPSRFIYEIPKSLLEDKTEDEGFSGGFGKAFTSYNFERSNFYDATSKSGKKRKQDLIRSSYAGTTAAPIKKQKPDYDTGDFVRHAKFGDGKVINIADGAKDYMVTVDFEDFGIKKMLAGFAKLEKI